MLIERKKAGIMICAFLAAAVGLSSCTDLTMLTDSDTANSTAYEETDESGENQPQEDVADSDSASDTDTETVTTQEQTQTADSSETQTDESIGGYSDENAVTQIHTQSETDSDDTSSTVTANPFESISGDSGTSLYTAYNEIIGEYREKCEADQSYQDNFCKYFIADIDDDGICELLAEMGTCEIDRTVYVYTYDGSQAELLGSFSSWHATLGDGNGVIYSETLALGSYILSTVSIVDGEIVVSRGDDATAESRLNNTLKSYSFTDSTGLTTA